MNDTRLERIEDKIDGLGDKLGATNVILAKQHKSLDYHIKRTDLLEKKLEPIERRINMIDGILKFLGILALIAGIVEGFSVAFK